MTIEDVNYGTDLDATAATAMLMTGAAPSVNGVPAARAWDTETKSDYPILLDQAKIGNFTDETFSPSSLRVSTISDEVRIADGGIGLVHSVAPDAQIAIFLPDMPETVVSGSMNSTANGAHRPIIVMSRLRLQNVTMA